jgi:hypothetical protein
MCELNHNRAGNGENFDFVVKHVSNLWKILAKQIYNMSTGLVKAL